MKSSAALRGKMLQDHAALREKLEAKGYAILGEFNCAGYNTNSFLKYSGASIKAGPTPGTWSGPPASPGA